MDVLGISTLTSSMQLTGLECPSVNWIGKHINRYNILFTIKKFPKKWMEALLNYYNNYNSTLML
jgi:hypothetical protein